MEKIRDSQPGTDKTRLVEQINICLRSRDYSRALGLLQGIAAEFPNDAELSQLEKLTQDGLKRNAEANRLITESQELFAQRKSAEALQSLRQAYELDKSNSLARAILANALVEHAHSIVETDWLESEKLTNQALSVNPTHPTAKTILSLIVERKRTSSVDEWVAQARKRQSSGDLFAALAWVAEGLAVHNEDPRLLQIQDEIQRDQAARRRQARRGDLEELRRMPGKIDAAVDDAAKRALAERIQAVAATYWTDGEILSIANALLLRLGLVPQEGSTPPNRKGAAVIFHVPRPSVPEAARANASQNPASTVPPSPAVVKQEIPDEVQSSQLLTQDALPAALPAQATSENVPAVAAPSGIAAAGNVSPIKPPPIRVTPSKVSAGKVPSAVGQSQIAPVSGATVVLAEPSAPTVTASGPRKQPTRSKPTTLILIAAVAMILVAAVFFSTRKQNASKVAATPAVTAPAVTVPAESAAPAPAAAVSAEATPEASALPQPSDSAAERLTPDDAPPASNNLGTLLIVVGQDNATVFLNGKRQRQLTRAGQLRLPNLEGKEYSVQVAKSGFQDSPQQKILIHGGEQARLVFNLQPVPRLASLSIQGGTPGATVLVDQSAVGSVQPDGKLLVSNINPGDHTVELRKDQFKPRQLKKNFVAGQSVSLAAADATLEASPGELKITFAPADAKVAVVKGDLLKIVSSGIPISLAAGNYTLTARNADSFTRTGTFEVVAGQSRTLDLSLAPNGMSKWDDPSAWKHEGDSFTCKGGDFVLYGVVPASGTFAFSAMPAKGHVVQWVINYTDAKNYVLFQIDENNFSRTVIRNGVKSDQIIVPDKGDKKSFRTFHIRVSPTEVVHQIKHGYSWVVLDRWTQPGVNLSQGKFGFYVPGNEQVAISGFAHYADLNLR